MTRTTKNKISLFAKIRQLLRELKSGQNAIFRYDREFRA
jgi:hypothetical protein